MQRYYIRHAFKHNNKCDMVLHWNSLMQGNIAVQKYTQMYSHFRMSRGNLRIWISSFFFLTERKKKDHKGMQNLKILFR